MHYPESFSETPQIFPIYFHLCLVYCCLVSLPLILPYPYLFHFAAGMIFLKGKSRRLLFSKTPECLLHTHVQPLSFPSSFFWPPESPRFPLISLWTIISESLECTMFPPDCLCWKCSFSSSSSWLILHLPSGLS